jgi:hypothetical protein
VSFGGRLVGGSGQRDQEKVKRADEERESHEVITRKQLGDSDNLTIFFVPNTMVQKYLH